MNKNNLYYILISTYIFSFLLILVWTKYNILIALIVAMTLIVTFMPHIIGNYYARKQIRVTRVYTKYSCYKAICFLFKIILHSINILI